MFFSANKLFSIGQFAKLHEINKKTLMWYDEIGLLKPAVVKENGYRYYTYNQSFVLEIILMLRELDVPIKHIQDFLKDRSTTALENLLTENLFKIDQDIARLTVLREVMLDKKQLLEDIRTLDLDDIFVVDKNQESYFVTIDISENLPLEKEIETVVEEVKKHNIHRLHDASYGVMLPVEKIYEEKTNEYKYIYIHMLHEMKKDYMHIQPKGKYIRAFHKGSWDELPKCYNKIIEYAKKHEFELYDFAYEKGINEIVIDTLDEYITQIEIPIK